jgi:hypothetical protein
MYNSAIQIQVPKDTNLGSYIKKHAVGDSPTAFLSKKEHDIAFLRFFYSRIFYFMGSSRV